ncbi:MAG: PIG-L family deacetylase [Candidatus Pacebacteria bacterium]|jgi:LmbE family N-acetylglucosaminyl deacetylase|nr:PIG-L family deacetylase [Candidatus Paceibacterota bacterium]
MDSFDKILIICPHTDDGELGCGGAIAKFIREGKEVFYAAFSSADESVPPGFPRDILKTEVREATRILGLKPENLILFNYPVRNFPGHRQQILDDLIGLKRKIDPGIVMLPSVFDVHQDHQVMYQEGLRAFKGTQVSILGYELPWNNLTFETESFVVLGKSDLDKKIAALACYKSQGNRFYMSPDFISSLAKVRGGQSGDAEYAETFQVVKWTIR